MAKKLVSKMPEEESPEDLELPELELPEEPELEDASRFNGEAVFELQAGTYFKIDRVNEIEAMLTEITVKGGQVISHSQIVDCSRILLGKLMRRIGENYAS